MKSTIYTVVLIIGLIISVAGGVGLAITKKKNPEGNLNYTWLGVLMFGDVVTVIGALGLFVW
ncbi:MAG: hypothetical protein GC154_12875 [bacterium]|nr:hypothetical protein [bacterium]